MKPRARFPAQLDMSSDAPTLARPLAPPAPRRLSADTGSTASSAQRPRPSAPPRVTVAVSRGHGLDSQAVRRNMVLKLQQQGVHDSLVLGAMGSVERHRFVDSALGNQAYEDTSLPIGLGQTISKPSVVARMTELLRHGAAGKLGRVLEIGTGCGYQAAVLSQLATEVYSMERLRGLHDKARENLRPLRLANVHLLFGDGMLGYPKGAPYAAIIAAAGGEAVPQAWIDQLAVGGRLVAPVCSPVVGAAQQALLVLDKTAVGLRQTILEAVHFVPLKSGIA